jgi:hypothetical protein
MNLVIICAFFVTNIEAQKIIIDSIYYNPLKGTVNASLSNIEIQHFIVDLKFHSPTTTLISDKNFISIAPGLNNKQKIIEWNIQKQTASSINQMFDVNVQLFPTTKYTPGRNIAYSFIWPGLGGKNVRNSNIAWLKGLLGWGLIASGSYFYTSSLNQYKTYSLSRNQSQLNSNLNKYNSSVKTSLVCFAGAAAIWTIDLATILHKNHKAKKTADYINGYYYIPNKKDKIEIQKDWVGIDTRSPYEIAMDNAYNYYTYQKYKDAKTYYEEALKYKPNDEKAKSQLRIVNDKLFAGKRNLTPDLHADLSYEDANKNGILEAGESSTLKITLKNEGQGYANNLQIRIVDNNTDRDIKIPSQDIDIIRNGESKNIEIPISAGYNIKTGQHRLSIIVNEKYGFDMDTAFLVLNTYGYNPPKIVVSGIEIIDQGEGTSSISNPDGAIEPGERVKVRLYLQNIGQREALNTHFEISTNNNNIFLDDAKGNLGTVNTGDVKTIEFFLAPNKRVAGLDSLPVFLSINEAIGKGSYNNLKLPIMLNKKPASPKIINIKPDLDQFSKEIAKFEYKSNKFAVNIGAITDIRKIDNGKTLNSHAVAVVIGIENYKNFPPAPYASNDATLMSEYFKKRFGIDADKIIMIQNEEASISKLREIFNPVYGDLQRSVEKNITDIYVYYSGHGMPSKDGKESYLFACDGREGGLNDYGYEINQFYADLDALDAHSVTVILDACFSGSSRSTEKVTASNIAGAKGIVIKKSASNFSLFKNFTVINSCSGDETSLGLDASESGLFTYFFCKGLQGEADLNQDHKITLSEMRAFVTEKVKDAAKKISSGGIQTPQFYGNDDKVLVEY